MEIATNIAYDWYRKNIDFCKTQAKEMIKILVEQISSPHMYVNSLSGAEATHMQEMTLLVRTWFIDLEIGLHTQQCDETFEYLAIKSSRPLVFMVLSSKQHDRKIMRVICKKSYSTVSIVKLKIYRYNVACSAMTLLLLAINSIKNTPTCYQQVRVMKISILVE